jgi:EAL domain-containing protein (putative c-di-GMP-specific phosphodiesterase class I)/GGDEF domain-containing protein
MGMRAVSGGWNRLRRAANHILTGPQALAFLPALCLAAYWLGGEIMLLACALGVPALQSIVGWGASGQGTAPRAEPARDIVDLAGACRLVQDRVAQAEEAGLATACILFEVEGLAEIARKEGEATAEPLRELVLTRLRGLLRRGDTAVRLGDCRYMVLTAPSQRLDLEGLLQMSARLQSAIEEPVASDHATHQLPATVGFCGTDRLPGDPKGARLFEAAQVALSEAVRLGPSAIRAWSDTIADEHRTRRTLLSEIRGALENGEIQPWFQPQICTSTGTISGVEALARWIHPERGIVPPAEFVLCLEEAGQMSRLTEVVLQHSLNALRGWDESGLHVPRVSVNFARGELGSSSLADRIDWELDRFGLTPTRLGVEVSEATLGAAPAPRIVENIRGLNRMGCYLELDNFGSGNAPLTALTMLPFDRIKIDRSFVSKVDRDEGRRRMLAAVIGLSERLNLDTLAEGVESVGEHALLAQLGCGHVQGFGIVGAMPADELKSWSQNHSARVAKAQRLGPRGS